MKTGERYSNDQNKNIYDHNRYWCSSVVWLWATEVPATTEALETVALKDAEIGDIVQMGTYEQDGDPETEDPICWDVLDKDGNAVLLISHDVIAYQRFSDNLKCVIWEDSQIRSWLNQAYMSGYSR